MSKTITISLPVTDIKNAVSFYTALGFSVNPQCSDEACALMTWSDAINVMLLSYEKWSSFTTRPIPPTTSSEVALNLSCASREDVDAMNNTALKFGGIADVNPIQDHGFMYGRDFTDLDGHVWGAVWMDMSAIPATS